MAIILYYYRDVCNGGGGGSRGARFYWAINRLGDKYWNTNTNKNNMICVIYYLAAVLYKKQIISVIILGFI